jgi:hypothetical protein
MELWTTLEYVAWGLSALIGVAIVADWLKTDATYDDAVLMSSREGELEALTEQHAQSGGHHG